MLTKTVRKWVSQRQPYGCGEGIVSMSMEWFYKCQLEKIQWEPLDDKTQSNSRATLWLSIMTFKVNLESSKLLPTTGLKFQSCLLFRLCSPPCASTLRIQVDPLQWKSDINTHETQNITHCVASNPKQLQDTAHCRSFLR